ncbi:MAG: hypothetical protein COA78_10190 [Blastopirellula sp.]|nr:MAG: hypothetical protein COA78_10190 [Blastopirellula sp.]
MLNRALGIIVLAVILCSSANAADRPNILFCISDDQSFAHTGANGDPVIKTPAFDRIAREGIRFTNAYCDAPTCGPSRSAILTGQHIWRLEEAGNIHSTLPAKFATYTELLMKAGYFVGYTGKGWSPGRLEPGGRTMNPAGQLYNAAIYGKGKLKSTRKPVGMSATAYANNFASFLDDCPKDKPFCFWLGTFEPHRGYKLGSGLQSGKDPAKVIVPPIFPDNEIVRSDILDYMVEIEHFDKHVGMAIDLLEKNGQLENTIIVVTSDHGMPFPRAKASLYDAGSKVPLAIRWPDGINQSGRASEEFVNLSDFAPTFLEAAGIKVPAMMTAKSLVPVFESAGAQHRPAAYIAMERHDGCRVGGKGYPCRAIRTKDYLYIHNFEPDRWPSGSPNAADCARAIPYGEIDSAPTKTFMMQNRDIESVAILASLAFDKRPAEELYKIASDPGQLNNLADMAEFSAVKAKLHQQLFDHLKETKDPRVIGGDVLWDYYPYYGARKNKNWAVEQRK